MAKVESAEEIASLEVHPARIQRRLWDELPFMATEEILMAGVRAGKLPVVEPADEHPAPINRAEREAALDVVETDHTLPWVRKAFVPPALPLPSLLMSKSQPRKSLPAMIAEGNEPIK